MNFAKDLIAVLNSIETNILAMFCIGIGALLFIGHEREGAMMCIGGGFALLNHKNQSQGDNK